MDVLCMHPLFMDGWMCHVCLHQVLHIVHIPSAGAVS